MVDVKKSINKPDLVKKNQMVQQNAIIPQVNAAPPSLPPGAYIHSGNYNPNSPFGIPHLVTPNNGYNWNGVGAHVYQQVDPYGYALHHLAPINHGGYPGYDANQNWDPNHVQVTPGNLQNIGAVATQKPNNWDTSMQHNFADHQQVYNSVAHNEENIPANTINPYSMAAIPNYGKYPYKYNQLMHLKT